MYHYESGSINSCERILVYMTYLNDCEGGTRFLYQGLDVIPKKGKTIIWPAGFTHTHKGVIDHNYEKWIATGWIVMDPAARTK